MIVSLLRIIEAEQNKGLHKRKSNATNVALPLTFGFTPDIVFIPSSQLLRANIGGTFNYCLSLYTEALILLVGFLGATSCFSSVTGSATSINSVAITCSSEAAISDEDGSVTTSG